MLASSTAACDNSSTHSEAAAATTANTRSVQSSRAGSHFHVFLFDQSQPRPPRGAGRREPDLRAPPLIWPLPPPFPWRVGRPPLSERRRARWKKRRSLELMVNLTICFGQNCLSNMVITSFLRYFLLKLALFQNH